MRQSRGRDAERHVMAVHLQNLNSTQPSRIEFCTNRRKHRGIGRNHGPLARTAQNHNGRDWRRFLAAACEIVQRDIEFLQVAADYRSQRVRAHRCHQRRTPAEKGKRHGSVRCRPSGGDMLARNRDLLIAPWNLIDRISEVYRCQANKQSFRSGKS